MVILDTNIIIDYFTHLTRLSQKANDSVIPVKTGIQPTRREETRKECLEYTVCNKISRFAIYLEIALDPSAAADGDDRSA